MHESVLQIKCANPELVKKSLEVDARSERDSKVSISAGKDFVEIKISAEKENKVKAIENSYKKLVEVLNRIDELE